MVKSLPILIFFLGCIQTYNSNSFDEEKYGPTPNQNQTVSGAERQAKAFSVIQKNCISCHFGRHDNWAGFSTDSQWATANLVIPGDAANSRLIRKLQNRGGNMPLSNPPLSEEDVDLLVDWIDQMESF